MLPDDVLLEIFDFYHDADEEDMLYFFNADDKQRMEEWVALAHVCRRWRSVVFQSPHRLNLRLLCTPKTPARDTLDIWPPFPLIICDNDYKFKVEPSSVDNIIAAFEHNDRVCQIDLICSSRSQLRYVMDPAVHKPFPELIDLHLGM